MSTPFAPSEPNLGDPPLPSEEGDDVVPNNVELPEPPPHVDGADITGPVR